MMFRFLQSIPRHFRQQWVNVTNRSPSASTKDSEDSCSHAINDFLAVQKRSSSILSKYSTEGRGDWYEWQRKCKDNFQRSYSAESVCWGTFVILGIHFTNYWHLWHISKRRADDDTESNTCPIDRVCNAFHGAYRQRLSAIACIKAGDPPGQASLQQDVAPTSSNEQEDVLHGPTFEKDPVLEPIAELPKVSSLPDILSAHVNFSEPLQSYEEESAALPSDEVRSAEEKVEATLKDFQSLVLEYNGFVYNQKAIELAKRGDTESALSLWQQAADNGNTKALFNLAISYHTGRGCKKDVAKAVFYYQRAALHEHPQSMYNLALLYMEGEGGCMKDIDYAVALLQRASRKGLTEASEELAFLRPRQRSPFTDDVIGRSSTNTSLPSTFRASDQPNSMSSPNLSDHARAYLDVFGDVGQWLKTSHTSQEDAAPVRFELGACDDDADVISSLPSSDVTHQFVLPLGTYGAGFSRRN